MSEDLSKLFKELDHHDPHFRQNAVRFLSLKFIKEFSILKPEQRNKIIDGLIKKLDKTEDSIEVKGVTVREFGKMAKILKEEETIKVFSKIVSFITDPTIEDKDIYVLCVKELLKEMNASSCHVVGKTIIPNIVFGIASEHKNIKELCFDAFNDYILKFNFILIKDSEGLIDNKEYIYKQALANLDSDSMTLRKITSLFIGSFSTILKKDLLTSLLNELLNMISNSTDNKKKSIYFAALSGIAKNTASKHAIFFNIAFPIIFNIASIEFLHSNNNSTDEYDSANELVESVLNLLDIYTLKISNIVKPNLRVIINRLSELIFYDPNYSYDNKQESEAMEVENEYEGYDDYMYQGYEDYNIDSEDSSWRVRRAAINCISSIVRSRVTLDKDLSAKILEDLIVAFREREENTKLNALSCVNDLLKSFIVEENLDFKTFNQIIPSRENKEENTEILSFNKKTSSATNKKEIIKNLVEKLNVELKTNNSSHKIQLLKIISSIAALEPLYLLNHLSSISELLESSFKASSENSLLIVKIFFKVLKSLAFGLEFSDRPEEFDSHYPHIIHFIKLGFNHNFYKVNIETTNTITMLISVLSTSNEHHENKDLIAKWNNYIKKYIEEIYNILLPKFKLNDLDQDQKLSLVVSFGNLVMFFGNYLSTSQLSTIFDIFYEKNENTNLSSLIFTIVIKTMKAQKLDISPYIKKYLDYVLNHSLKFNIQIQHLALEFILTILKYSPDLIVKQKLDFIVTLNETMLSTANEESLIPFIFEILKRLYTLVDFKGNKDIIESTLLKSIDIFNNKPDYYCSQFFEFVEISVENIMIFDSQMANIILKSVLDIKSTVCNLNKAKCIAIISNINKKSDQVVAIYLDQISKDGIAVDQAKWFLLCIGEICLKSDNSFTNVYEFIEKKLISAHEDLKPSYAACLGKVSVSNIQLFIKNLVKVKKELVGFYFISVRESLTHLAEMNHKDQEKFANISVLKELFDFLISHSTHQEEQVRLLSGESLGLLALVREEMLVELISSLKSNDENKIVVALYSLKYVFSTKKYNENQLKEAVDILIANLDSNNIKAKTMAYSSLVNFTYNYINVLRNDPDKLNTIFQSFENNYKPNPDLVEVIDLGGGVKIKNDKGNTIRKSIFSILKIFFEQIPEKMKFEFSIMLILEGLKDNDEIQSISSSCLNKLSTMSPNAFISVIDPIIEIFYNRFKNLNSTTNNENNSKKLISFCDESQRFISNVVIVNEIDENPKLNEFKYEVEVFVKNFKREQDDKNN